MKSKIETKTEKVIEYLNSREIKENKIFLATKCYSDIKNISTKEFIEILFRLQERGLLTLQFVSHKDGRSPCFITPTDSLKHYFEYEKEAKSIERNKAIIDYFKWIVPVIMSSVALLFSFISLYISLNR